MRHRTKKSKRREKSTNTAKNEEKGVTRVHGGNDTRGLEGVKGR